MPSPDGQAGTETTGVIAAGPKAGIAAGTMAEREAGEIGMSIGVVTTGGGIEATVMAGSHRGNIAACGGRDIIIIAKTVIWSKETADAWPDDIGGIVTIKKADVLSSKRHQGTVFMPFFFFVLNSGASFLGH